MAPTLAQLQDHDEQCEAEFIEGPMLYSPCLCIERAITDDMLEAFDRGWHSIPEGVPGTRRRAGLAEVIRLVINA